MSRERERETAVDETTDTPTEPQPGSWLLPGRITERTTAGNRWIEAGELYEAVNDLLSGQGIEPWRPREPMAGE
jgi:hypothetical protein